MKLNRSRIWIAIAFFGLWLALNLLIPNENEKEAAKLDKLEKRNHLEKQLVGKWNHNAFPAGMNNGANYHLLSADAGYRYRGSDQSKTHGGHWSVGTLDSVLILDLYPKSNSSQFKITEIQPNKVVLQQLENGKPTTSVEWFRHP